MKKILGTGLLLLSLMGVSFSQNNLSTVCLKTSLDSVLAASTGVDTSSMGLEYSISGTCDSVTLYYDDTIANIPMKMPFMTLTKVSPCSLKLSVIMQPDTFYNVCNVATTYRLNSSRLANITSKQISASISGSNLLVSWKALNALGSVSVDIISLQGRVVSTFSNVGVQGTRVININNAGIMAGNYRVLLRSGNLNQSVSLSILK